jgi:hypothetical protein
VRAKEKALAVREDEFVGGQGSRMSRLEREHMQLNEAQAALEAENAVGRSKLNPVYP